MLEKSYVGRLSWLVIHKYQLIFGNTCRKLQYVEMYEKLDRGCRILYIFIATDRYAKIPIIVLSNITQTNTDNNKS